MNSDTQYSLYPIIIRESRYGGLYEGGRWFATARCAETPEQAIGNDAEAMSFWNSPDAFLIGVGDTPNDALANLYKRYGLPLADWLE